MIDEIREIYLDNNYVQVEIEGFTFFKLNDDTKKSFSVLIDSTPSDVIDKQDEIFGKCKEKLNDPAFNKNCSLLILYEIKGDLDITKHKDEILQAEENPYLFKKQVLYYRESEVEGLKKEFKNNALLSELISEKIGDLGIFSQYKKNPSNSWQSLLYRIACKLPFINIDTKEGESLISLFDKNKTVLEEKNLNDVDRSLFSIISQYPTLEEIEDKAAKEIYESLLPLLSKE